MEKRRVMLFCARHLLGESLQNLLGAMEHVDLIGPYVLSPSNIGRIEQVTPDVVLIAEDDDQFEGGSALTTEILERFPNLPVLHSTLTRNVVKVYTSRELPARSADLAEVIRSLSEDE